MGFSNYLKNPITAKLMDFCDNVASMRPGMGRQDTNSCGLRHGASVSLAVTAQREEKDGAE
jgi:hypothetical protein